MVSTLGDWSLTTTAAMYPGMDYKHWFVHTADPDDGATKDEIIDSYIKTLGKVVGSEEEAKKRIYKVNCVPLKTHVGFGCKLDWETASLLEGLPGVDCISPDWYRDPEFKDYGGELFVNGKIVQRSAERERRLQRTPLPRFKKLR